MDDFLFADELIRVVGSGEAGNRGTADFQVATGRKFVNPEEKSSREQSVRHMMRERLRREREKEAYFDLHSMLPPGTKHEKNAIMRGAMMKIEELQGYKQALERRIMELQGAGAESAQSGSRSGAVKKIRIKVGNPISGLDSMLEVQHLLKRLDVETTSIESRFSRQEFEAAMDVETQMDAGEVEKAVQKSLYDTERKLLSGVFPRRRSFAFQFQTWQQKDGI